MLRFSIVAAVCWVALGVAAAASAEEAAPGPVEYRGNLVNLGGGPRGASAGYINLRVDQLSTDEEVKRLAEVLAQGGQDALLKALWSAEAKGYIKVGGGLGYDVQVIRSLPGPDGTRIVRFVTDRPIQFGEVYRGTRSMDYPFGIVELRLGADGKGEGIMIFAAQAKFGADGKLEVESYSTPSLKILKVKTVELKPKKEK